MRSGQLGLIFVIVFALFFTAQADVTPDPGYKRISLKLILESQDDLADYRFFIKSGADVKEIILKKGEKAIIEPLGGGAYYSSGTLIAVPEISLEGFQETPSGEKLTELQKAVYDGKAAGGIELVKHRFSREILILETGWQDPVYRIERDGGGLKAVHVSGAANVSKTDSAGLTFWRSAAAAIVAAIFLVFGLVIIGVWYFRRSSKVV